MRVEESYPAFAVVSASDEAVAELRSAIRSRSWTGRRSRPRLGPRPQRSRPGAVGAKPVVAMSSFDSRHRCRPAWLKAIEKLGALVKRPLGASAVVASVAGNAVLAEVGKYDKVDRVDNYVPDIRVSPGFFKNLVGEADDKVLTRAAARLDSGDVQPPRTV